MKNIIIIALVLSAISINSFAQHSNLSKKEIRQMDKIKRQEEAKKAQAEMIKLTTYLIEQQRYVLLADELSNQYGARSYVNRMLNFIVVDSTEAIIQVGNNTSIGANGVGGFTIKGNISKYEKTKNEKKGSYFISFWVNSPAGSYDVNIQIYEEGSASATVSSATLSGRLMYYGDIEPVGKRKIFKGNSL